MKRAILAALVLITILAAAYGYDVTSRETRHRELIDRGDAAMAQGDVSTAIEAFSGAIALKDDSMIGYLKRGDAYRRRDELEAAVRDLRQAAEIDPSATRPRELLGDVNYARHRFGPAAEHYEAYVRLDDSSPRVLYKLALARYREAQPALAVAMLEKAVALDPRFAEAYYLMGLCERDAQRSTQALVSLRKAIELSPGMIGAREELSDLCRKLGRTDEALSQLEAIRALEPSAARDVALGVAYANAGQIDRAVLTLRNAAERDPAHSETFVALGRVWLETAQSREDRVDLGKALEALAQAVGPDVREPSSDAYTLYGRALLLAGETERAERVLQQATDRLPVDPLAFYYLADAAERRGHNAIARRALVDFMAISTEEPDRRRRATLCARIADLSVRDADYGMAVDYYARAADVLGGDPDFLVRFADAYWRAGDSPAARVQLARALEKDPAHAAARALARRVQ